MTQPFDAAMEAFAAQQPALPLGVALSGGADSIALLAACAARWSGQVRAIHVHHGLQSAAAEFEAHCIALCQSLQVPLAVVHVDARHAAGDSPEDAARRARYAALDALALANWMVADATSLRAKIAIKKIAIFAPEGANLSEPIQSMALAQHADDQVETLLLALSRGAGLPGLAAMPAQWPRAALTWHRPLLAVAGGDVRDWATRQGLSWMEDPSNADRRYTRNRIRHEVLPALAAAFPSFRDTFARSAQHAASAQAVLDEVAAADAQTSGLPPRIAALQALAPARQANLLRHWLRAEGTAANTAQLGALQRQIDACRTRGHRIHLRVGQGHVTREGEHLRYTADGA